MGWLWLAMLPGVAAGADQRQPADVALPPWNSLVRVQTEAGGRCTGALIAPDRVLTAAHCLVAPRTGVLVQPGRTHALAGYDRGEFRAHARGLAFTIGPGFDPARRGPAEADWAVIRLATPLPGPALSMAAPGSPGTPIWLGGWQQDRAHALLADTNCRLTSVAPPLLRHDCTGTRGSSGGPLLVRTPAGFAIVGVAVAASRDGAGGLAVRPRVSD